MSVSKQVIEFRLNLLQKSIHTLENHLLMNLDHISHLLTFISSLLLYTQIRIDYSRVSWGKISQASAGAKQGIGHFLM